MKNPNYRYQKFPFAKNINYLKDKNETKEAFSLKFILYFLKSNPTLLIAFLTIYVYVCEFYFYQGENDFYKLDSNLLDITVGTTLQFSSYAILYLAFVMFFLTAISGFLEFKRPLLRLFLFNVLLGLLVWIAYLKEPYYFTVINRWPIYLVVFFVEIILIIPQLNLLKKYRNEVKRQENEPLHIFSSFLLPINDFLLPVIGSSIVFFLIGYNAANFKSKYMGFEKRPNSVIIRIWNNEYVCKQYNSKFQITDTTFLINISDTTQGPIVGKNIKLHP